MKRVVRLLRVILSIGKVEFWVCMGGMVVVGGVLAGGLGLGDTVEVLVSVLIGLLHLCRCLGVGIVVGLSEGGIVVVGGNVVVKALGGKVNVVVCMCGNVVVGGIVGICVKVAVSGIVADILNEYFINIAEYTAGTRIPALPRRDIEGSISEIIYKYEHHISIKNIKKKRINSSFGFEETTYSKIRQLLTELNPNKPMGIIRFHPK